MIERVLRLLEPEASAPALVAEAPRVGVREIFRRFWPYARPYRWLLLGSVLLVAVVPALETIEIWLYKRLVDDVLVPRELSPFFTIALLYLGLNLLGAVVSFVDQYLSGAAGERFILWLRTSVFRHLHRLSPDVLEKRRLGDLLSRLTSDVNAIEQLVISNVTDALSYVLRIAFFSAALFYLRWDLALASLVVAPVFFGISRSFSRRIQQASREKRRRGGSIGAVAEESLANAALVQAYNQEERETDRLHDEGVGAMRAQLRATRLGGLFSPAVDLADLVGAMVIIGMGTWELSAGRLSLGGLLVFLAYLSQLYSPINGLATLAGDVYTASAGAERIIELLDEEPAVVEKPDARAMPRARGEIVFENVSLTYPERGAPALEDVSFRVRPGETLAIVGASGAGKSTIAKLLLRFVDPDGGRVLVDGQDIRHVTLESLRDNLAVVFQETFMIDGTVADNIAIGRQEASDEEIFEVARTAGLHEFIESLPDDYATRVGQRGRRLSGGQRQRLAIARALLRDAPVIFLDEPTAALDPAMAAQVLEPLRRLMHNRTTIVVSHDLVAVRDATEILVLHEGRVVERGSHSELRVRGGAYAALAGAAA